MKRLIILFVVALLIGVSAASATTLMRAKPAPVVADSTKHDSTAVRVIDSTDVVGPRAPGAASPDSSAHADSASKHPVAAVSATLPAASTPAVTTTAQPTATSVKPAPGAPALAATAPAEPAPAERRIARVIAAMAPRDAAKVLTQLTDHDVAVIIGSLTEKQEAAILAQLPPDRLSAISKLALRQAPVTK